MTYLFSVLCCFLVECRSILAVLVGLIVSSLSLADDSSRSEGETNLRTWGSQDVEVRYNREVEDVIKLVEKEE